MSPRADERAGFKSLDDLRLCILALASFREAAELGILFDPRKPAAPHKEPREQRNGRAVRHGHTAGTVQIFYYFADGSSGDESQVRDTNKFHESRKEPRGR